MKEGRVDGKNMVGFDKRSLNASNCTKWSLCLGILQQRGHMMEERREIILSTSRSLGSKRKKSDGFSFANGCGIVNWACNILKLRDKSCTMAISQAMRNTTKEHVLPKLQVLMPLRKDEDVKLIIVPSTVRNTEEKSNKENLSTNSKHKKRIALKHLGKVSENTTTSTTSVNTGSEPVNTGSFDPNDSPMPELEIFHTV
ncbi:hypothetical protein Tco_0494140 [Tanacetum coccineum]